MNETQDEQMKPAFRRKPVSRRWLGVLLGLLVSAVTVYLVFQWAGWEPLVEALRSVNSRLLILAVGVFLISMVARALSWRELLNREFTLLQVLAALNEGYLLNNILPWRLGELGRAILLGRKGGSGMLSVLSTIMVERLLDVFIAFSIMIALLPTVAGLPEARRTGLILAGILIIGAVVVWILLRDTSWIQSLFGRLPGDSKRWQEMWERLRIGLLVVREPDRFLRSFAWISLSWFLAGIQYWLVLSAVLPEAKLLWAYFMLTVTLLGVAVPSSPGFIGVFEAAGVLALSAFGVPRGEALAASLLIHGMVYILGSSLGIIAMSREGDTLVGLYRQIRSRAAFQTGSEH
ncbi:MAG: lysylphosphatidylglycerol synthase transmembrane domain-containing protein [Anaerolineales bacterium]|nr:lysylphosphatidylglycerol synthase transmembrane domain-containing protein [Anaerolineales bacterium]